jgi:hypothetical protein
VVAKMNTSFEQCIGTERRRSTDQHREHRRFGAAIGRC